MATGSQTPGQVASLPRLGCTGRFGLRSSGLLQDPSLSGPSHCWSWRVPGAGRIWVAPGPQGQSGSRWQRVATRSQSQMKMMR